MDISILLFLQEFRNGAGSCLTSFMSKLSFIGEMNTLLIFLALIYWCLSKEYGRYFLMGWSGCRVVNGLLKVTACVYRPWIRDARIIPDADALASATGYSFPSGHATNAGALYGGGALRKEFPKILRRALAIIAVLIPISRIFLGVHTPQDILVGLFSGVMVMWLTMKLLSWLDKHPEKDILVICLGIGIAAAVALFAAFKSYPIDYDEAGKILVDGAKMANDTYKGVGWCIGFMLGWALEKRHINFSTDVPLMERVIRLVTGLLSYYSVSLILNQLLKTWIPGAASTILTCFIQMFYITFIFPWFIKKRND